MANILRSHSLYLRNCEIIQNKKDMFRGFFDSKIPLQDGRLKKQDLNEEKLCTYSFFLEAESRAFRFFLNACEARNASEERSANNALIEHGNSILSTQYNNIIFHHVPEFSLVKTLLNQDVPYLTVLQYELPFRAALCNWADEFRTSNYSSEKLERVQDYSFDIRSGGQKVGSVKFHKIYALAGELLMDLNPCVSSPVYVKETSDRKDAKFMDLTIKIDGTRSRRTGSGKPQDLAEALCSNLLGIDFAAFAEELYRGIVLEFDDSPPEIAKADFGSIPPSEFKFGVFTYTGMQSGTAEFGTVMHAELGDSGYYLKVILPKNFAAPLGDGMHTFDRAFAGGAFVHDRQNVAVLDLQDRYPLREHPLSKVGLN